MADTISMTIDDREFMRMVNAGDRVYQQSAVSSLNKAGKKVRTQVQRKVAKDSGIPVKAVRQHAAKTTRASRTRFVTSLGVLATISARHFDPTRYGDAPGGQARGPRGGIKAGGYKFSRAFIAEDLNGKKRVFRRAPVRGLPKSHDFKEEAPDRMVGRGGARRSKRPLFSGADPGSGRERALRSLKIHLRYLDETMERENERGFEYLKEILPRDLEWRLQRAAR